MLQPVEPAGVPASAPRSPLLRVVGVAASVPVILWVALWFVAPGFMEPVLINPPAVLGLPGGVVLMAFAGGMALFGWLVARRAPTLGIGLGALTFLSIPALVLIVMAPALILFVVDAAG